MARRCGQYAGLSNLDMNFEYSIKRIRIKVAQTLENILKQFFSWSICGALLWASFAPAQTTLPVQVYAIALEYRLDEAGTKQYNRLLQAVAEEGLKFNVLVRSLSRSLISMKTDQGSCLFPATVNALVTNDNDMAAFALISSDPIDEVSLRVLTNSTKPLITSIKELEGKRIAILNGLHSEQFLGDVNADVEPTPDEYVRLKMLTAGRLDAVLSFIPDILLAAEDLGLSIPHFDEHLALLRDEGAAIVCHDNADNRAFIAQFNDVLRRMKASGELQRIMGKYAVIVP